LATIRGELDCAKRCKESDGVERLGNMFSLTPKDINAYEERGTIMIKLKINGLALGNTDL
jgi:hypothetical protein